jgi:hypothetical protein
MPPRNIMTPSKNLTQLATMGRALKEGGKKPLARYTQGGSSRAAHGAKVAGVDASVRPTKKKGTS